MSKKHKFKVGDLIKAAIKKDSYRVILKLIEDDDWWVYEALEFETQNIIKLNAYAHKCKKVGFIGELDLELIELLYGE